MSEVLKTLPIADKIDEKGRINNFRIDQYINAELVIGYYNNPNNLCDSYKNCDSFIVNKHKSYIYPLGDFERLQRLSKVEDIKEKRKMIVQQLELLGECKTEMEFQMKNDIAQADSFIVEAYDKIGKDEIERLKYNRKKIKEAMILADYHKKVTGTEIQQMIYNTFEVENWYSREFIKTKIIKIFKELGITPKKAITSHTILDFFIAMKKEQKRKKGYYLIKKKLM